MYGPSRLSGPTATGNERLRGEARIQAILRNVHEARQQAAVGREIGQTAQQMSWAIRAQSQFLCHRASSAVAEAAITVAESHSALERARAFRARGTVVMLLQPERDSIAEDAA